MFGRTRLGSAAHIGHSYMNLNVNLLSTKYRKKVGMLSHDVTAYSEILAVLAQSLHLRRSGTTVRIWKVVKFVSINKSLFHLND